MSRERSFDYVLVGGGLANGLVALALAHHRPTCTIAVVERGQTLGGNHTWCFHGGDVPSSAAPWIDPLVVRRWDGYRVSFPGFSRRIGSAYACVSSEQLHHVVASTLSRMPGSSVLTHTEVADATSGRVVLTDGRVLDAGLVVDARGPDPASVGPAAGYQKFLGLEVELAAPHRIDEPIVIDADIEQRDGFRFLYALPFGPTRALLEDTYFSDTPELDAVASRRFLLEEIERRGLRLRRVLREESGVLPLPWESTSPSHPQGEPPARPVAGSPGREDGGTSPFAAGWKGGWFHPVTGYSFPSAVRVAQLLATSPPAGPSPEVFRRFAAAHHRQRRFAHLLNWMLFRLYEPGDRRNVLARFYGLPEDSIRRFYALETTTSDRARILCGRPPRGLTLRRLLQRDATTLEPSEPPT